MTKDEIFTKLEDLGHQLRRNDDGSIDEWVLDAFDEPGSFESLHGPGCILCKMTWVTRDLMYDFDAEECPDRITGRSEPYPRQTRRLSDNQIIDGTNDAN